MQPTSLTAACRLLIQRQSHPQIAVRRVRVPEYPRQATVGGRKGGEGRGGSGGWGVVAVPGCGVASRDCVAPTALGLVFGIYPAFTRWANFCRAAGAGFVADGSCGSAARALWSAKVRREIPRPAKTTGTQNARCRRDDRLKSLTRRRERLPH